MPPEFMALMEAVCGIRKKNPVKKTAMWAWEMAIQLEIEADAHPNDERPSCLGPAEIVEKIWGPRMAGGASAWDSHHGTLAKWQSRADYQSAVKYGRIAAREGVREAFRARTEVDQKHAREQRREAHRQFVKRKYGNDE